MPETYADGMRACNVQDYQRALQIWRALAAGGDMASQSGLGFLYANGFGVDRDMAQSAHWYLQAAEQGDSVAQINLGGIFCNNDGVPQDYVEAYKWLSIAKVSGKPQASSTLVQLEATLSLAQLSNARQRSHAWLAIRQSNPHSSATLAHLESAASGGYFSIDQLETILPRLASKDLARQFNLTAANDHNAAACYQLAGILELSFFFNGANAKDTLSHQMVEKICLTPDELQRLAVNNLHRLVHPNFVVKQMSLSPPDDRKAADAIRFFYYIETGNSLEAACLLIAPIWESLRSLVKGELRVAIPNQHSCLFCGSDDSLTLRMMRDISRDIYLDSATNSVSLRLFTFDPSGVLVAVEEAG